MEAGNEAACITHHCKWNQIISCFCHRRFFFFVFPSFFCLALATLLTSFTSSYETNEIKAGDGRPSSEAMCADVWRWVAHVFSAGLAGSVGICKFTHSWSQQQLNYPSLLAKTYKMLKRLKHVKGIKKNEDKATQRACEKKKKRNVKLSRLLTDWRIGATRAVVAILLHCNSKTFHQNGKKCPNFVWLGNQNVAVENKSKEKVVQSLSRPCYMFFYLLFFHFDHISNTTTMIFIVFYIFYLCFTVLHLNLLHF